MLTDEVKEAKYVGVGATIGKFCVSLIIYLTVYFKISRNQCQMQITRMT